MYLIMVFFDLLKSDDKNCKNYNAWLLYETKHKAKLDEIKILAEKITKSTNVSLKSFGDITISNNSVVLSEQNKNKNLLDSENILYNTRLTSYIGLVNILSAVKGQVTAQKVVEDCSNLTDKNDKKIDVDDEIGKFEKKYYFDAITRDDLGDDFDLLTSYTSADNCAVYHAWKRYDEKHKIVIKDIKDAVEKVAIFDTKLEIEVKQNFNIIAFEGKVIITEDSNYNLLQNNAVFNTTFRSYSAILAIKEAISLKTMDLLNEEERLSKEILKLAEALNKNSEEITINSEIKILPDNKVVYVKDADEVTVAHGRGDLGGGFFELYKTENSNSVDALKKNELLQTILKALELDTGTTQTTNTNTTIVDDPVDGTTTQTTNTNLETLESLEEDIREIAKKMEIEYKKTFGKITINIPAKAIIWKDDGKDVSFVEEDDGTKKYSYSSGYEENLLSVFKEIKTELNSHARKLFIEKITTQMNSYNETNLTWEYGGITIDLSKIKGMGENTDTDSKKLNKLIEIYSIMELDIKSITKLEDNLAIWNIRYNHKYGKEKFIETINDFMDNRDELIKKKIKKVTDKGFKKH